MKYTTSIVMFCAIFVGANVSVAGDYLVTEGYIKTVSNTGENLQKFAIQVTGGTNNKCPADNTTNWIHFPLSAAPDLAAHQRAYATALLAFSLGKSVTVYNYIDNTCLNASYIQINK